MKATSIAQISAASVLFTATMGGAQNALADSPHSFSANIGAVSNYIWRGASQTQDGAAVQGGIDYSHVSGFYAGTWLSNIDWNDEGSPQDVVIEVDPETGMPATDEDGNLVGMTSGSSSSTSPNYELDLYMGFGGSYNDFSYDLSTIYYAYPDGRDSDFWEIGASGSWKWFTLGLAYTVHGQNEDGLFDQGDLYYYGGAEFDLPYDFGLGLNVGYYDFTNDRDTVVTEFGEVDSDSADYWHWNVSISRSAGDFGTFSLNYDQNNGKEDSPGGWDDEAKFWVGWLKEF